MTDPATAVVSLSGGQDSATCLFYARDRYDDVLAVSFDYGQRHRAELKCAHMLAGMAAVPHRIITVPAFAQLADAALTNARIDVAANATENPSASGEVNFYAAKRGLPSTFVPGRNIVLLGLAAAYGLPRNAEVLVTGVCATDEAGYPDCRPEFVTAMEQVIALGMDCPSFVIDAPLLHRTKAQTWELAAQLGVLELVVEHSHTCYEGNRTERHDWGYGCGKCPACTTRAAGYAQFLAGAAAA